MSTDRSAVIVFDGICVLCTRWLRFVLQHDDDRVFRFTSMQSPAGRHLLTLHGLDADDPVSFLLLMDGRQFSDTEAVIRVLSEFGGSWRAFRLLRVFPRWLRDPVYRFVARHRYRLFGQRDACLVPEQNVADRFIENISDLPDWS